MERGGHTDQAPSRLPVTSLDEVSCWATPTWADPCRQGLVWFSHIRAWGLLFTDGNPTPWWGLVKKCMNLFLKVSGPGWWRAAGLRSGCSVGSSAARGPSKTTTCRPATNAAETCRPAYMLLSLGRPNTGDVPGLLGDSWRPTMTSSAVRVPEGRTPSPTSCSHLLFLEHHPAHGPTNVAEQQG